MCSAMRRPPASLQRVIQSVLGPLVWMSRLSGSIAARKASYAFWTSVASLFRSLKLRMHEAGSETMGPWGTAADVS